MGSSAAFLIIFFIAPILLLMGIVLLFHFLIDRYSNIYDRVYLRNFTCSISDLLSFSFVHSSSLFLIYLILKNDIGRNALDFTDRLVTFFIIIVVLFSIGFYLIVKILNSYHISKKYLRVLIITFFLLIFPLIAPLVIPVWIANTVSPHISPPPKKNRVVPRKGLVALLMLPESHGSPQKFGPE